MGNDAVAIAAVVMTGLFLTVVAWQVLAIARTAVDRDKALEAHRLKQRLDDLEKLHHNAEPDDHTVSDVPHAQVIWPPWSGYVSPHRNPLGSGGHHRAALAVSAVC